MGSLTTNKVVDDHPWNRVLGDDISFQFTFLLIEDPQCYDECPLLPVGTWFYSFAVFIYALRS